MITNAQKKLGGEEFGATLSCSLCIELILKFSLGWESFMALSILNWLDLQHSG